MKTLRALPVHHLLLAAFGAAIGIGLFYGYQAYAVSYPSGLLAQGGITDVAQMSSNSGWNSNLFSCPAGHTLQQLHYDCNCSNNATWYQCVPQ